MPRAERQARALGRISSFIELDPDLRFAVVIRFAELYQACVGLAGLLAMASLHSASPSTRLWDAATADLTRIRIQDCAAKRLETDGIVRLRVDTGHRERWPGITVAAPSQGWDLSAHDRVVARVRNPGPGPVQVFCRVDNEGANGTEHCVTGNGVVPPGAARDLVVWLPQHGQDTLGGKLFGLRGYPVARRQPGTLDPSRVTQLLFFLSEPKQDQAFEVERVQAEGASTPPTAWVTDADPYFPLIDLLGQYRHKQWPGKAPSAAELPRLAAAEARELSTVAAPAGWDVYGGWKDGPQLRATGFFRTEKVGRRWWLVDPEGRLFFSHGIDCVRMLDTTAIEERETWFESKPWTAPEFAEFLTQGFALKGHYAGRTVRCFSFGGANLKRKYGDHWGDAVGGVIHQRLRAWGLNTIGMWSDEGVRLLHRTPYVDAIGSGGTKRIEGSEGYWGKFPDVFDSSFQENLRRSMEGRRGRSAGDPWCLGYFADNEMSWGDDLSLGLAVLQSPAEQAAKQAFLGDLRRTYGGDIAKLNQAWGTTNASWDALRESRTPPDKERARVDLEDFYLRVAETYFRGVRDAIREVAPQQLYLGCRFAGANARAAAAAAKFCDVVSYNLYQRSVADFAFNGGADVPLIIGEFHFGALDRGLFHTGLVPVGDQAERAQAYTDYVRGALRHPQFVGCHWFQYQDEPTTGRVYDEENYQIGFVSIADVPYAETVAASRQMGEAMYGLRSQP